MALNCVMNAPKPVGRQTDILRVGLLDRGDRWQRDERKQQ
jgi:hypothetical protein